MSVRLVHCTVAGCIDNVLIAPVTIEREGAALEDKGWLLIQGKPYCPEHQPAAQAATTYRKTRRKTSKWLLP